MNDNIKEWACSLSGCDGGNIKADTWLCGIEWGGGSYAGYYDKELPLEISEGSKKGNLESWDWKESVTYPYGRSFAKLYTSLRGGNVEDYMKVCDLKGDELFKTNLYPIAFDSTDPDLWHKHGLDKITGFENKYIFNTWCFFNRFPHFAKLRKENNPQTIVCTGINYLLDFLMFFGGNENIENLESGKITPESEANTCDRTYYWVKLGSNTLLIIIPFLSGRYGLNSNYLLQEMGSRIRRLVGEQ